MFKQLIALTSSNLRLILRDRILHAVLGVAVVLLLLVPALSGFSMRQVQELAITLCLSAISLVLLVLALLLGSSAVWRDIERRYTSSVLPLPVQRSTYILAKFASISLFLSLCGLLLLAAAACVIPLAAAQYTSDLPIAWGTILLAVTADVLKSMLVAAVALLLSSVSTSFFLPFFGTISIYLAGSASQEVYEYLTGQFVREISPLAFRLIEAAYYLLPNFAAFDFKVHAVYVLDLTFSDVLFPLVYALSYSAVLLGLAIWSFNRRQLP